jgi:endonuclease YncB( thermonuclease family)
MSAGKSVRTNQIPGLLLFALLSACEPGDAPISGHADVIDGDSLEIGATSIRLFGVDAFEGRQTCTLDGRTWACGEAAAARLAELIDSRPLACTEKDIDSYGRTVARCTAGSTDLAAQLAREGLALAYRQYSEDYVDEEAEAKSAGRGAWAGGFVEPWDWRAGERDSAESPPPSPRASPDCLIKGNINREGERIYHLPGAPYYDQTIIDETLGERWFCTAAQAERAGWRGSLAR